MRNDGRTGRSFTATTSPSKVFRQPPSRCGSAEEHAVSRTRRTASGTILIFILVAGILLGIVALAYPQMLTAAYWRTAGTQTNSVPQAPPPAAEPTAPAARPASPPVDQPAAPSPNLNAAPTPPPSSPTAPDLNRAPAEPAPPAAEAPQSSVPVIDATPKPAPSPRSASRPRASERDDRGAGGFYAKVPGPGGAMEYQYFPAHPDSNSSAPARREPAVPDRGGFYAKVPGPDGTLQSQYFPRQPPPPR